MPYISKEEREQMRWITLVDAIRHVDSVDGCDQASALDQLIAAIVDEELSVKWGDTCDDWVDEFECLDYAGEPVPSSATFWSEARARIRFENGGMIANDTTDYAHEAARDPEIKRKVDELDKDFNIPVSEAIRREKEIIGAKAQNLRQQRISSKRVFFQSVLLSRDDVLKLWPLPENQNQAALVPPQQAHPQQKQLFSASDADITKAADELYDQATKAGEPPPNLTNAERQVSARLNDWGLTAKRDNIRLILNGPQYSRRPPGNQPKK